MSNWDRSTGPHPSAGSKRVHALIEQQQLQADQEALWKQPRQREPLLTALFSRQTGSSRKGLSARQRSQVTLSDIQLQGIFYTAQAQSSTLPLGQAEVVEVISNAGMVIAINRSGRCTAFCRVSGRVLCELNSACFEEDISALYWNKCNWSLVVVTVANEEECTCLRCYSIPAQSIKGRRPVARGRILGGELKVPGFVEFDDVNDRALTHCVTSRRYNVYDLYNYHLIFSINDVDVEGIQMSPGVIMSQHVSASEEGSGGMKRSQQLKLRLRDMRDGALLKEIALSLEPDCPID
eukprot:CAMPEP_0206146670 /NCGR_PEP_ID=MMETSP1473-20131121/31091_1 /ASSEMBLY_ACC=CAM_ASM_001109 /TAXON_ID=1461547 /ORGANISM="Stichococcus sp, Strain RCC1054" /LENGTH=293 /DNA_ID=CAMNT_0053543317 /DNA_START=213 /DNA_END=1091 /DNA_ORIENTATION=-